MAKAKQAPAVSSSADLCEWAAEVLRLRFDEVMSFSGAVMVPWNVNGVHDMRVALRRLRSSLRDFVRVIDEKPLRRVKTDLKKISDLLGVVRDLDVAIIAMEEFASESRDGAVRAELAVLTAGLRSDREQAHSRLQRSLESISLDDLRDRFSSRIEDSLRQQELFGPGSLIEAGRIVIGARLQELDDLSTAIYDPFDGIKLHELRIAVKRLRYALDLFEVGWGDTVDSFTSQLSKMQSYLGDVHDCDVWTITLTKLLKESGKAKTRDSKKAAAWLLSRFVGKRAKAYRASLDLWNEWETDGFADRLRSFLGSSKIAAK